MLANPQAARWESFSPQRLKRPIKRYETNEETLPFIKFYLERGCVFVAGDPRLGTLHFDTNSMQ